MNKNIPDVTIDGHHLNDRFYFDKGDEKMRLVLGPRKWAVEIATRSGNHDADDFKAKYLREQLLG